MDELRTYLATLSLPERQAFAARCGTTLGYLRKLISLGLPPREKLCTRIEVESACAVTRRHLRPDDWRAIWPEMARQGEHVSHANQAQPATKTITERQGV